MYNNFFLKKRIISCNISSFLSNNSTSALDLPDLGFSYCHQKFKRIAKRLIEAIAVAVSSLAQGFTEHLLRSFSMPADAHAAANARVNVICT
jgi:hypothetical protein